MRRFLPYVLVAVWASGIPCSYQYSKRVKMEWRAEYRLSRPWSYQDRAGAMFDAAVWPIALPMNWSLYAKRYPAGW